MKIHRIAAIALVLLIAGFLAYLFLFTETARGSIPADVTGEVRSVYDWAKTPSGGALLEHIPCYCGCKDEGHHNARNCFWRDDGAFDRHGATCSVCLDIAKRAKVMFDQGRSTCDIRNEIDAFYAPNAQLGTDTPFPEGCQRPAGKLAPTNATLGTRGCAAGSHSGAAPGCGTGA